MSDDLYDVTIIGGGPAGLFAAFYAGLRGMRTKIIDSLDQLGGQLTTLYPEKFIYDVAGFPAVLAKTLVNELIKQADQYDPAVVLNEQVQSLRIEGDGVIALGTQRATHRSRSAIITAGAGAFSPKKLPGVNCDAYEGRGVSYSVKDLSSYRNRRVLVVGGGDSAVDWGLNLQRVNAQVTCMHRVDRFRAHEDSVAKLLNSKATIKTFHELRAVHGDGRVEAATIFDNRTGAEQTLQVDHVLIFIGFNSTLGPIRDWGLALDKNGIVVNSRMETNIPGVYAAGDVASFEGKLKLIVTGFGEAATAVNHAKSYIDPRAKSFPGHSSSMVPKRRDAAGIHESGDGDPA